VAFVLYAHVVPQLRSLGTALLAGVSLVSIILGLAAQNTLGNLIAGISLILYRPLSVGDDVELNTPKGVLAARVEDVSLGYTILRDAQGNDVVVPNSVMVSNIVIRLAKRTTPDRPR
jgi:small-conductance mechanosensitive channel